MRVGTLEIQLLADMARLSTDMKRAEQVVGGAMGNVERSVASAKRAMQSLAVGLPIAAIVDQVRRMSDQYTKLDAQIRLATKSQAAYAQGLSDIRRISSVAQADISATTMLYTRLMNVMDGTGVSQAKLATVTETISFGLKAYGATTQEAASAALQLSQAMGANRLGGEEFRAVMEAMPNVMKVLADSMGVPLGELRALSIAGKITADEMIKAFGNPAVAAQFKALAQTTQTVTGAWQVARNELMLLVGEFSKSSGLTSSTIAAFNAFGAVFRVMADNIGVLTNALLAYTSVMVGKFVIGLAQARAAQIATNIATAEAAIANVAAAEAAVFAAKSNLAGAAAAARAGGSMALASVAAREYAASVAALAVAEKAQAASSVGIMGRIKGLAGKAGWIGMAIFGAWSVYDFLNGMQAVADGADKLKNKFDGLSLAEIQNAKQRERAKLIGMRGFGEDTFNAKAIRQSQDMIREYDLQINKMIEVRNAEEAAGKAKITTLGMSHDQQVMQTRMIELADQFNKKTLTEAEYLTRVNEALYGSTTAAKAHSKAIATVNKELLAEREAAISAQLSSAAAIDSETASLVKQIEAIKLETESIGKDKAEIDLLQAARFDHETQIMRETLATLELAKVTTAESAALRDAIKVREQYKKAQTDQSARRKMQEAIDAEKKANIEMWKSIDTVAHDTWTRVWTEGSSAFTNIGKTIKSAILDMLYQMTVKKWIISASMTATGGASGVASAAGMVGGGGGAGGSGDIMSWLSTGKSIYSAISGGFTALGTSITNGVVEAANVLYDAGFTTAGNTLGANAGNIGVAGSYIGAGLAGITIGSMIAGDKKFAGMSGTTSSTIGAIAGAIVGGPIGAAIGGALGGVFNAAFGSGPKSYGAPVTSGTFTGAGFQNGRTTTPWSQSGGWFGGGGGGLIYGNTSTAQNASLSAAATGSKAVFDALTTSLYDGTRSLQGWSFSFTKYLNTQAEAESLIMAMSDSMGLFLVPELNKFVRTGETLADTAMRMIDTVKVTDSILSMLNKTFSVTGFASLGLRQNLVDLFGGAQNASAAMQTYYNAFYSENEKVMASWKTMAATLHALGISAIPTTNAQFRKLVEAQDLSTTAGQSTFAALVKLSPVFDSLTTATTTLEQQTASLNNSMTQMSATGFHTLVDYTRAMRLAANASTSTQAQVLAAISAPAQGVIAKATLPAQATLPDAIIPPPVGVSATSALAPALTPLQQMSATLAKRAATLAALPLLERQAIAMQNDQPVPQFAAGGIHTGGLRIVGENGPELEYTGPSRIVNSGETKSLLSNADVVTAINALREELRAGQIAISGAVQKTARLIDRWDGDGMPEVREAA